MAAEPETMMMMMMMIIIIIIIIISLHNSIQILLQILKMVVCSEIFTVKVAVF
jgi:hypothetical protein